MLAVGIENKHIAEDRYDKQRRSKSILLPIRYLRRTSIHDLLLLVQRPMYKRK